MFQGWVLYDGTCRLCLDLNQRFKPILSSNGFETLPLQTDWVKEKLGFGVEQVLTPEHLSEMRVLTPTGIFYGGGDALIYLSQCIWWAKPFYWLSLLPGMRWLIGKGYHLLASKRHCYGKACTLKDFL